MPNSSFKTSVVLLCLGWALIYADRTTLYPLLTVIGSEFNLSSTMTGFLTSTYFLVYVAMQTPAGIVGDYIGLKKLLIGTYLLAGLALLGLSLISNDYWSTLAAIALHAFGAGAYGSVAYGLSMQEAPDRWRGLAAAAVNSGMSLGLALGLATSGPLYVMTHNWRIPFLILSIPTIILAFLFQLLLPEKSKSPSRKKLPSPVKTWKNKNLLLISFVQFCSLYGFWVTITWGPTFFQTERGFSIAASGLYLALIAAVSFPIVFTVGMLMNHISRRKLGFILFPITALTIMALACVQSKRALILTLIIYGIFGKFVWDPVGLAWIGEEMSRKDPQLMGTAMGFFNFSGMASAVVAPLVSGWLRDTTGTLTGAFYLAAVIVLLACPALYFASEPERQNLNPARVGSPGGG
ncbi:MAG: hypothetical protein PWP65_1958 [Clostridia bacterium]|nr:hypothetical protein [Clostridia bacterium]